MVQYPLMRVLVRALLRVLEDADGVWDGVL